MYQSFDGNFTSGIQALNFDESDTVGGGVAPAIAACAANPACVAAVKAGAAVTAVAVIAVVDYFF